MTQENYFDIEVILMITQEDFNLIDQFIKMHRETRSVAFHKGDCKNPIHFTNH